MPKRFCCLSREVRRQRTMDLASLDKKCDRTICRRRCFEKCRRIVQTSQTSSIKPWQIDSSASSSANTCTLLRSIPHANASLINGSTREGCPNTTPGAPEPRSDDSFCMSSATFMLPKLLSGSGSTPSKETRRFALSKQLSLTGCTSAHISNTFLKSRTEPVDNATIRIPGISERTAPRIPRASAEVFPHCGAPWRVMKLFCSSWKADMIKGMMRRCISSGLSKLWLRSKCCIVSASFSPNCLNI
mmetsp:Transcript_47822/g.75594  ORF Transcript_47822/g.75594 Transcript_47822/m.75594 type:complete len:245 (-) Transcript_47822:291-1025(-)